MPSDNATNKAMTAQNDQACCVPGRRPHTCGDIHAVDTRDQGQRHEDGRDHGELLHDLVHSIALRGQVDVHHRSAHILIGLNGLECGGHVVADVLKVPIRLGADDIPFAGKFAQQVTFGCEDSVHTHKLPTNAVKVLQIVLARVVEHRVLYGGELLTDLVHHWQRRVHQQVHDLVQHPRRTDPQRQTRALDHICKRVGPRPSHRHQMVSPDKHVKLRGDDAIALRVCRMQPGDEEAAIVVVDLGAHLWM